VRLAWATVGCNITEAIVAITAGGAAGSIALIGFGLDSIVEVLSALVILWQFCDLDEKRERRAIRLIAMSFWALALYVTAQAIWVLGQQKPARHSPVGIGLAIASLTVMPMLATGKRRAGQQLGSITVTADSKQSSLCAYLSAILLTGLVLETVLNWWWADPLAAIGIAILAANEGRQAWHGDNCCD
jgi:divalent metal cation (Fe/Co/Zn/Cd) transporter